MDVRQLRYFVSIVDYGSLGKAADKLYVAQPSLSQQMARLEEELGVTLLLRSFESMSGYLNELLANGRLDLAILFRESDTPGITALPVLDETLYLMGEPGGTISPRASTCALAKLAGVKQVAPGASNGLRLLIERTFASEKVELNIVADIDSLPSLLLIAHSGRACTILPSSAVSQWDVARLPKIRRIVDPVIRRPASICWPSGAPMNAATVAVRETLIRLIAEHVERESWEGVTMRERTSA